MRPLYHFTCLFWLPDILSEGIKFGEVPIRAHARYDEKPQAVNLTYNPDRNAQDIWNQGITDKARVRITLSLPVEDLVSFKQVREKYKMQSSWVKVIAPGRAVFDWCFFFGTITQEHITKVEIYDSSTNQYQICEGKDLKDLQNTILRARENFHITGTNGDVEIRPLNPDVDTGFLLDGPRAAKLPKLV